MPANDMTMAQDARIKALAQQKNNKHNWLHSSFLTVPLLTSLRMTLVLPLMMKTLIKKVEKKTASMYILELYLNSLIKLILKIFVLHIIFRFLVKNL